MKREYNYVIQANDFDCGLASLITILKYYKINPSREKLIKKIGIRTNGYSAYDLIKMGSIYGLKGEGIKTNLSKITTLPVIAHTIKNENYFHFIVILKKNEKTKKLVIMDPSSGIEEISFDDFNKITTNIFLIFKKETKEKIKDHRFRKELFSILKPNKKLIIKSIVISILFIIFSLIFNTYLKIILESKLNNYLLALVLIFLNISLIKNFLKYLKDYLILNLNIDIDKKITNKLTSHLFNLPYSYFTSKTTGELVTILEDIENFKEAITKIFVLSSVDLLLTILVLIYIYILNPYIGLIITIVIILIILITKKYQYIFNNHYIKYKQSKINYSSNLIDKLTSFETIKNLNIGNKITNSLHNSYNDLINKEEAFSKKYCNYDLLIELITDIFYIFVLSIGVYLSNKGYFNIYDLALYSSYFYIIIGLLTSISSSIADYKVYKTGVDKVLDCLEEKEENLSKSKLSKINKISINNLSYKINNKYILNNLNLDINKPDKIYLTGKSGIGKSSLIKILLRYIDKDEGQIKIDNIDINNLDLSFIRNSITYIGQNEKIYKGTILDNLSLTGKSKEEIDKISKITLLDKFLEKNNMDYNYLIEEDGYNLSGGERKKIVLTRGLLKKSEVLILDEVFNEISEKEERIILKNILKMYKDKIVIVISHRTKNKDLFTKKYELIKEGDVVETK